MLRGVGAVPDHRNMTHQKCANRDGGDANYGNRKLKPDSLPVKKNDQNVLQRAAADPFSASPDDILALQGAVGNRAVLGLIQAKLMLSSAGDKYEREADRMAQRVTEMPDPGGKREAAGAQAPLQAGEPAGGKEEAAAGQLIQRRPGGGLEAGPELESRLNSSQGGSRPLQEEARSFMEPRFNADFSKVRIHTGSEAGKLSSDMNARAFTRGRDIYFRSGEYNPGTPAGRQLLAHELTHTLQQGASERIAGWWPQGHRNITQTALTKGGFNDSYDEEARNFLVERSPDMDGIKDEFNTMQEGRGQGKGKIKEYNELKNSNDMTKWRLAKKMYINNELHIRDQSYMLHHGEGGYYKKANGASINEGMTSLFVDKATNLWNTGDKKRALVVLSDALHQAEDRGSHQEGNAFHGHDSRIKLNETEWEKEHFKKDWDPDNISINKDGAAKAVGLAQGVLNKFKNAALDNVDDKISIGEKDQPKQRTLFGVSARFGGRFAGSTGVKNEKGLTKLLEGENRTYKRATKEPKLKEGLGKEDKTDLYRGLAFYEKGTRKEAGQKEYEDAKKKFKGLYKGRLFGGQSKEKRREEAGAYYKREINKPLYDKKQQIVVGTLIKAAYKDVTGAGDDFWDSFLGLQQLSF